MNRKVVSAFFIIYFLAATLGFYLSDDGAASEASEQVASYIVQGSSTAAVVDAIRSVDGEITHEFEVINAVAATLTSNQKQVLQENPEILAISEDVPEGPTAGTS